jgi:hypothetical protein
LGQVDVQRHAPEQVEVRVQLDRPVGLAVGPPAQVPHELGQGGDFGPVHQGDRPRHLVQPPVVLLRGHLPGQFLDDRLQQARVKDVGRLGKTGLAGGADPSSSCTFASVLAWTSPPMERTIGLKKNSRQKAV